MKLTSRNIQLNKLIINPFLIGLVITMIIALFLKDRFKRYEIKLVDTEIVARKSQNYFNDLDGDSLSEWIEFSYDNLDVNFPYYTVYEQVGFDFKLIIDQYNIERRWLNESRARFGDVDGDGNNEILHLTVNKDSLFLFCGDPLDGTATLFETFLVLVNFREDSPDFIADIEAIYDFDGDGSKDILVKVTGGQTYSPREYFIYNYGKDTLIRSHLGYVNVYAAEVMNVPGYGPLILPTKSYTSKNVEIPTEMTDTLSWLILMDKNLDLFFNPIPFYGYKTSMQSFLIYEQSDYYIYALIKDHDLINKHPSLKKYDLRGNLISERELVDDASLSLSLLILRVKDNKIYLNNTTEKWIARIMPDLSTGTHQKYELDRPYYLDLDNSGDPEIISIIRTNEYKLNVYRSNLKDKVQVFVGPFTSKMIFSPLHAEDGFANIAIQLDDVMSFFKYEKNSQFYWNFTILLGIWFILSISFLTLLQFQKKMLQKRFENEKKLLELELMTIKNQVDPHFMFNTMTSIGSYILKEDKKKAYQYLIDFSNMIRSTLVHSKDISISLEEELAFVKNYLDLELVRADSNFDYHINLGENIDNKVQVPKMIIQTFAENAVRHGLRPKKERGLLQLNVYNEEGLLLITIEDNGIGREGSKKLKTHSTGHGQNIVRQIISLFNRLNDTDVTFNIKDLLDEQGNASGTLVRVKIPLQNEN